MIEVACSYCGKILLRHLYRMGYAKNQFCGGKCHGKYRSANIIGKNHPTFLDGANMVIKPCAQCGKPVTRHKSKAQRNKHFFCGKDCYAAWRSINLRNEGNPNFRTPAIETHCATCGKIVMRKPWRIGMTTERLRHFCSLECKYQWHRDVLTGENSPAWKGGAVRYYGPKWRTQRRAARKRDGYKCRTCGVTQKQNKKALDVHHIIPFKDFDYIPGENENYLLANDLNNLVSLCRHCHKAVEAGNMPLQLNLL